MAEYLIDIDINGVSKMVSVRASETLLHVLRTKFGLTGVKPSCLNGDCGCCAILMDGRAINSCMMLAVEADGHHITTIEGLKDSPVQRVFLEHNAYQCGYCTPGFVLNAHALVNIHPNASDEEIDDWFASNLCRCTGYSEIKEAVEAVLRRQEDH